MADLERYKLLVATIEYADGTGSKTRPAMVITFNNEVIKVLRLTSQFDNKFEKIRSQYFEIIDWYKAGLKKPSWIDTVRYYEVSNKEYEFDILGKLTDRDIERFKEFIKERLK
ncbi:hypothetical protein [Streptococcus pluranimalium]